MTMWVLTLCKGNFKWIEIGEKLTLKHVYIDFLCSVMCLCMIGFVLVTVGLVLEVSVARKLGETKYTFLQSLVICLNAFFQPFWVCFVACFGYGFVSSCLWVLVCL